MHVVQLTDLHSFLFFGATPLPTCCSVVEWSLGGVWVVQDEHEGYAAVLALNGRELYVFLYIVYSA